MKVTEITKKDYTKKYKGILSPLLIHYVKQAQISNEEIHTDIQTVLENSDSRFWIFEDRGKVFGFCLLNLLYEPGYAMLEHIYFAPKYNKRDYIRVIRELLKKTCRRYSINRIYFIVKKDYGFKGDLIKRHANFMWPGTEVAGMLFYQEIK